MRNKEEALSNMQHQLRQRETQVFVLEEQTIELLENEDKRLKDKESELKHWERLLKKEVKRRLAAEGNLPTELRGILYNKHQHVYVDGRGMDARNPNEKILSLRNLLSFSS